MTARIAASEGQPMVDMRTHILTVSSALILEKGVKNMSLKDIAKTAGISKGTLYYYYSAKEDIIFDIARRNMDQITKEILLWIDQKQGDGQPPQEMIDSLFQKMLNAEASGKLHLHLLNDAVATNEKLAEQFRTLYEDWRRMLNEALTRAYPEKGRQNEAMSWLILAIMDGLMIQKICGPQDPPLQDILGLILH